MKDNHTLTYILFVVAQMILCNYFHFTPFVMLTILPVLVFFLPVRHGTASAMLIAFATGFAVDYFAEGTLGINAFSLVPVAFVRRALIETICGSEPFEHKEDITIRKYGFAKILLAVIIVQSLFLAIYTVADCAGTRPLWFILARFGASLLASVLVSMLIVKPLTNVDRR